MPQDEQKIRAQIVARDKERETQKKNEQSQQKYKQDLENARNMLIDKNYTMTSVSDKMRDILKKYPELDDGWVEKQLQHVGHGDLYSPGVANALRKGRVASEKSYVDSPEWQEFYKDDQEAKNKAAKKYGGETKEYFSHLSPEGRELEKKSIEVSQQPILDFLSQMGQPHRGNQNLENVLSILNNPEMVQRMNRIATQGPRSFDTPSWMPSGQDMYSGLQSGLEGLYGGAKSGLEGLMGYGQSGMQGLQNMYNNWGGQQQQNPMDQQQQMEQKLALLSQHDPSTGLGGRIKQRRI